MILPILSSALLLTSTLTLASPAPAPFRADFHPKPVVESRAPKENKTGVVSIPLAKGPAAALITGKGDDAVVDLEWLVRTKARTQRKYASHAAEEKRAAAGEGLTDSNESLWFGPITIGGESFNVDFDTGSADLWVPSSTCNTGGCVGHNKYSLSRTGQAQSGTFSISYGDGSATSGPIYKDNVVIAGLTATGQTFSAATQMAQQLSVADGFPPDGILGMAFPSISSLRANPFFQTLVAQGKVNSPVFSFYLAQSGSELYLGGINPAKYTGAITYTPVTQANYWTVALGGIKVNGKAISSSAPAAIIDTGTTLIYGPQASVASLYGAIPGSKTMNSLYGSGYDGYYLIPCASIPTVSMNFGGRDFSIPASKFSLGQVSRGSQYCVGAVLGSDQQYGGSGTPTYLVGDAFLSSVYSIYDVGQKRVGFAQAA